MIWKPRGLIARREPSIFLRGRQYQSAFSRQPDKHMEAALLPRKGAG